MSQTVSGESVVGAGVEARVGLGIAAFVVGLCFTVVQAGLSKMLVATLPVLLVAWGRYAFASALLLPAAWARHGAGGLKQARPGLQLLRGALMVTASASFIAAVRTMPLADAIAVVFFYPFLVTALTPLVLKEPVAPSSWLAVAAGFVGVVFVVRPTGEGFDLHALLALNAGACFGLHLLLTRRLTQTTPALVNAASTAVFGAVVLSVALPWAWQAMTWPELGLLVLVGIGAAMAQLLVVTGCGLAPMATLAPFGYFELIGSAAVGYVLFGHFPDAHTWTGAAVIVLSGLWIVRAQRAHGRPLISRSRPPAG